MPQLQHILHYSKFADAAEGVGAWERALMDREIVVLRVRSLDQAKFYIKSYPLIGLMIDLGGDAQAAAREIAEISGMEQAKGLPLVGLAEGALAPETQESLAAVGIGMIWGRTLPAACVVYQFESLRALRQAAASPNGGGPAAQALAESARKLLHDLSQPLAALQGRLQILEAKAAEDDPIKRSLRELVGLSVMVSDHLRELHELHRKGG